MNIEIITLHNANLKETGFGSWLACSDVMASLELMGHSVLVTICSTLNDLDEVVKRAPDLVVLAAKYMPLEGEEKLWFSEFFALNQITFSGSDRETLKYDSNKIAAKQKLASLGIKTAKYFTAKPDQYLTEDALPFSFPLFIKPTDAANGNGIDDGSFAQNFVEFTAKVLALSLIYKQPALVEEYLGGKEFTVSVIKSSSGELRVSPIEIVPPVSKGGLRMLGAEVKISDSEKLKAVEIEELNLVQELAIVSFNGLGVRGFGRIDIKMDTQGNCYFMEANLVPGMNRNSSYFPKAYEIDKKISYDDVVKLMLDESLNRAKIDKDRKQGIILDIPHAAA